MNEVFKKLILEDIKEAITVEDLKVILTRLVGCVKTEEQQKENLEANLRNAFNLISKIRAY